MTCQGEVKEHGCELPKIKRWHKSGGVLVQCGRRGCSLTYVAEYSIRVPGDPLLVMREAYWHWELAD